MPPHPSQHAFFSTATRIGAVLITALMVIVSGCSGGADDSSETLAPIASTLAPNEPVVVIGGESSGSEGDVALSEGSAGDAAGGERDAPAAATVPLDIDVVDELLSTTPPSQPSTTTNESSTTTTTTIQGSSSPTTEQPTTTTTAPSAESSTTSTTNAANLPGPVVGPPQNTIVLADLTTGSGDAPDAEPQPLKVVRYAPEGAVDTAPFIAVTFNQPMIALAGIQSLTLQQPPITIEPAPTGRWRWVGARTVRFEVAIDDDDSVDRLPAATDFRVTVSADIESVSGERLGSDVSWTFSTPPPSVVSVVNAAASDQDDTTQVPQIATKPVFVARFDQKVDPSAVVAVMGLTAGDSSVPVRIATATEIEADPLAADAVDAAPSRTVAVTPTTELPTDTDIVLTIGPDIPSAEGPSVNPDAVAFVAHTHGPLSIIEAGCLDEVCNAGTGLRLEFNNPIDTDGLTNAELVQMLTVQPDLPGLSINLFGSTVVFEGLTAANTTYTLSADAGLTDVFGQSLGETQSRTVAVGDALPQFRGPTSPMVVLDPESDTPKLAVETVNYDRLIVSVWAVSMRDYADYLALGDTIYETGEIEPPEEWQRFDEREITIRGGENELVTTEIDLDDEFAQAGSQLVVYVRPEFADEAENEKNLDVPLLAWVQQTSLAIDAIADDANLLIWTTDLTTGEPIGGVPVDLIGDGRVATTDDEGIAVVKLDDVPLSGLFANDGSRIVFLPAPGGSGWTKGERDVPGRWSVITDRGVYRPGDTVELTGWLRELTPDSAELLETPPNGTDIAISLRDAVGNEIASGSASTNSLGGFSAEFELPDDPFRGEGSIVLSSGSNETTVPFRIEDFRTPEFSVKVSTRETAPFVASNPVNLIASGEYYSGGPVSRADTDWTVSSRTTTYRPPNRDAYTFGRDGQWFGTGECLDCRPDESIKKFDGTTDGSGSHYLKVTADDTKGFPTAMTAEASITDINRHTWAGSTSLVIHPGLAYVGLKTDKLFVEAGDTLGVDAIATGIDGGALDGRDVTISVSAVRSSYVNGEWNETLDEIDGCAFTSIDPDAADANAGAMRCEFRLSDPGQFRIVGEVADEDGNVSRTELDRWVSGSLARASSQVSVDTAQIVPDRASYQPGDTARLLISSPWAPARGVVAISRFGITETIPFDAENGSAVVEVPITERSIPNAIGWVTMAGSAPRLDRFGNPIPGATRPAVATAQINLPVPATSRTLSVATAAESPTILPGQETSVNVQVDDDTGAPVSNAQVAVMVVDEAVLALTDYKIADPADQFYAPYFGTLSGTSVREYVQLLQSDEIDLGSSSSTTVLEQATSDGTVTGSADDRAEESGAANSAEVADNAGTRTRANFTPLAVFSPDNTTDDNGRVTVEFRAPDNLTSYRIIALAVADQQRFGFGESTVSAGQPLEVRPSAPSFVRLGDRFSLPVVLRNQTDNSETIEIAADPTGVEPTGSVGQRVTIPARSRVEVRFDMVATVTGRATVRFVARGASNDQLGDSVNATLDVFNPATTETVATYAALDAVDDQVAAVQPVVPPSASLSGYGGLDVDVNSTILANLVDAVAYLRDDSYTSTSANASRLIAISSLADVLVELNAPGLGDPAQLNAQARRSMNDLISSQREDGGWTAWPRQDRSDPWSSVLAAHALTVASGQGWLAGDAPALTNATVYLTQIDENIPNTVDDSTRWAIQAYAIKVLALIGGESEGTAARLAADLYAAHGDDMQLDAVAMVWPSVRDSTMSDDIERRLTNAANDTASGVTFSTDYDDSGYVIAYSDQRSDAFILDGFLTARPGSDVVPKAMEGLLANRTEGRWSNDQANAIAAVAVRHYFDRFEADNANMTAQAWIGDKSVLEHTFVGSDRSVASVTTPLSQVRSVATDGTAPVTVSNTGTGRLYFRVGMTYATDGPSAASDNGFVVERIYEPITEPGDVVRNPDGSWTIKAGAPVRVRLTMVADAQRTNVALTDPFPAGLEPVNPSLAVSQTFADPEEGSDESTPTWRGHGWFDHQSLTATRAEAIATLLPGGVYEYAYVARAITPGEFSVPPARAEELYHPETFGRSASDVVTVVNAD